MNGVGPNTDSSGSVHCFVFWSITDFGKQGRAKQLSQSFVTFLPSLLLSAAWNSQVVLSSHWLPPDKAKQKYQPWVMTKAKPFSLWKYKKDGDNVQQQDVS